MIVFFNYPQVSVVAVPQTFVGLLVPHTNKAATKPLNALKGVPMPYPYAFIKLIH